MQVSGVRSGVDTPTGVAALPPAASPLLLVDSRRLESECLSSLLNRSGFSVQVAWSVDRPNVRKTERDFVVALFFHDGPVGDMKRVIDALGRIQDAMPIIFLSPQSNLNAAVAALEQGAKGYVPTNSGFSDLIGAIQFVIAGGTFLPASCVLMAGRGVSGDLPHTRWQEQFTAKQVAVIEGIRRGKSNKVIAYELAMCESTVKVHIRNVMRKLKVKNRTELAFKATEIIAS